MKEKKGHSEPVIDITGEEEIGGSTSSILSCDKCDYKTSQSKNLKDHKKLKHEVSLIPCEVCEYVGKSSNDYNRHVKDKHAERNPRSSDDSTSKNKENVKKSSDNSKQNYVEIPCDLCKFKSTSAEDFIKHIENKHQEKPENSSAYDCDKCDFKGKGEDQFKKHLGTAHNLNVGGWKTPQHNRSSRPCINWNRGQCGYDESKCRYDHVEIIRCLFKERCSRSDCRFWHERSSGKFPFLDYHNRHNGPNIHPRRAFHHRN